MVINHSSVLKWYLLCHVYLPPWYLPCFTNLQVEKYIAMYSMRKIFESMGFLWPLFYGKIRENYTGKYWSERTRILAYFTQWMVSRVVIPSHGLFLTDSSFNVLCLYHNNSSMEVNKMFWDYRYTILSFSSFNLQWSVWIL